LKLSSGKELKKQKISLELNLEEQSRTEKELLIAVVRKKAKTIYLLRSIKNLLMPKVV
jgi:hypothetical protein